MISSAPMTPMNEYATASFTPVKMYGTANGSETCSAVETGPRRWMRAVFTSARGTRSSPLSVFTITATNPSMNPISTCGTSPSPKITMNSG